MLSKDVCHSSKENTFFWWDLWLDQLSPRRRWRCGSPCWDSWATSRSLNASWSSTTAARRSRSWRRSTKLSERGPTRESFRSSRWRKRWGGARWFFVPPQVCGAVFLRRDPCLREQNSSADVQKRNSVRHKLVSLTLKRKSKITEEVRLRNSSNFELIRV